MTTSSDKIIKLPSPQTKGKMSVEEAIARRRSIRAFRNQSISLAQLSQILWSAQGITDPEWRRLRAVPSAGATYPLELFISVSKSGVEGLKAGVYHYEVSQHSLLLRKDEDVRAALAEAALGQRCISLAPTTIVVGAVYERIGRSYGKRAERYAAMEAGHLGQNIHLEAVSLGLATVMVGAFDDTKVAEVLGLESSVKPIYIMPLGYPTK